MKVVLNRYDISICFHKRLRSYLQSMSNHVFTLVNTYTWVLWLHTTKCEINYSQMWLNTHSSYQDNERKWQLFFVHSYHFFSFIIALIFFLLFLYLDKLTVENCILCINAIKCPLTGVKKRVTNCGKFLFLFYLIFFFLFWQIC